MRRTGRVDSYRVAHPDPAAVTGDTWSPAYPDDPQDRIDSVTYRGPLTVVDSRELTDSQWTSDHRAVLTTFRFQRTLS